MKHDTEEPIRVPLGPEPVLSNAMIMVITWDQQVARESISDMEEAIGNFAGVVRVEGRLV